MRASIVLITVIMMSIGIADCARAADPRNYSGAIIDAHAHIRLNEEDGLTGLNHPIGTEALRKLDDDAGVVQSALIVIARKGQPEKTRAQNDAVIAAALASGKRFYAVVSVHPGDGEAAFTELARVAKLGAKEVKLHPNTQNFDVLDPDVSLVVEKCGELGLVVLFDSYKPWDPSEVGKFMLLAIQHPKTKIVLAHMGFVYFRDTIAFQLLRKIGMADNVWFDLSVIAATYADSPVQPELLWTIRNIGTERFLFGSDWPVDSPAKAVHAVRRLGFTYSEQKQIFHDNVTRLLGP